MWELDAREDITVRRYFADRKLGTRGKVKVTSERRRYRGVQNKLPGDGKQNAIVVPHEQYLGLTRHEQARREAYRALFKAHLDPEVIDRIRSATNGNVVLAANASRSRLQRCSSAG